MKTNYSGIDYSGIGATCNRDKESGIRYGIIPAHDVGQSWYDAGEPDYGDPHCPKCGNEVKAAKGDYARYEHSRHECSDYVCHTCKYVFGSESAYGDEPCGIEYDSDGYKLHEDDSGDLWVFKSPYFTHAQFCSPCAPGACYLSNPIDGPNESNKCYCLGADWFDDDNPCPYPVYSVETGNQVVAQVKNVPCSNCGATGRDSIARVARVRQCAVENVNVAELRITGYRDDGTFDCFRCNGKGTEAETQYVEVTPTKE